MKRHWAIGAGWVAIAAVIASVWYLASRESVHEGRTTSQWLAALEAGPAGERTGATDALRHIGNEALPGTRALLDHPVAEVRLAAFDVLEGILDDCSENFQVMSPIGVSGRGRAARAVPPIAEAMTDCYFAEDETLRRRAETAMAKINWYYATKRRATAERLLDVICERLESDKKEDRERAATLFHTIVSQGEIWQSDLLKPTTERLLDAAVRHDRASEPLMCCLFCCLVELPQDADLTERVQAIEPRVVDMLLGKGAAETQLADSSANEGEPSAGTPGKTGTSLAEPYSSGQYNQASVRCGAAMVLQMYGTRDAVPGLCQALEDEDENVARLALNVLLRIGDPRAIPAVKKALNSDTLPRDCVQIVLQHLEQKQN